MDYGLLADATVVLHLLYVLFAALGALLVLWRTSVVWIHLPAVAWAALVEFTGWPCPLTPLEVWLRTRAGSAGYRGDFVQHYLLPILYSPELTREVQIALGVSVLAINVGLYGLIIHRKSRP